jgi:hypothetical protein
MIGKLKSALLVMSTALIFALPATAAADSNSQIFGACSGNAGSSPVCQNKQTKENPAVHIINVAVNLIAVLAGVAAVIMIILGGISFMTAGGAAPGQRAGDPNKIAGAKRQITFAIIGLVVVALAWSATRFITSKVLQ